MYKNTIQLGHGRQNKDFLEDIFRVVGRWNNKIAFYLVRREYFRATLYFICILNYVQRYSYFKPLFRPNFSMVINTAEDFLNIASNCEIYDTTIILSKQLTQPDSVYVAIDNISIYNNFIFTERGVVYKDITKLVVANFSLWLISK